MLAGGCECEDAAEWKRGADVKSDGRACHRKYNSTAFWGIWTPKYVIRREKPAAGGWRGKREGLVEGKEKGWWKIREGLVGEEGRGKRKFMNYKDMYYKEDERIALTPHNP